MPAKGGDSAQTTGTMSRMAVVSSGIFVRSGQVTNVTEIESEASECRLQCSTGSRNSNNNNDEILIKREPLAYTRAPSQSSLLAESLWTDPGLKNGISARELISTLKKKCGGGE